MPWSSASLTLLGFGRRTPAFTRPKRSDGPSPSAAQSIHRLESAPPKKMASVLKCQGPAHPERPTWSLVASVEEMGNGLAQNSVMLRSEEQTSESYNYKLRELGECSVAKLSRSSTTNQSFFAYGTNLHRTDRVRLPLGHSEAQMDKSPARAVYGWFFAADETGASSGGADAVLVDGFWERCDEGGSHRKGLSRRLSSSMQDVVNQRESYRATKASRPASCFEGLFKHQDPVKKVDVLLVGGGIMSATLALLLKQLEPDWKIVMIERLAEVAQESSNGWNNAGTGHSALCEPNYTPEAGKTVDIHKAVTVNENFQLSRQYWAHLAEKGLVSPSKFISQTPHMTFAHGEEQIAWLKKRFEALKGHPLFQGMEYTEDPEKMKSWAPLMMEGRDDKERCAFTRVPDGTDVDFGELTKELTKAFISLGGDVQLMTTVCDFAKDQSGLYDETWIVTTRKSQGLSRKPTQYRARFVFIGAGGYALPLLQKTKIPDVRGFMGFPISGEFLVCQNPEVVAKHGSKVYGKAAIGAPPMSVPHLDARVIGGKPMLLFGPFAGFSPRFLKTGSLMDLFRALKLHNVVPAAAAGLRNLDLTRYLLGQLLSTKSQKLQELRSFLPEAEAEDWSLVTAGQRVQIMKRDPKKIGGERELSP
ncbi:Probable malate:quinone oxidoreductase (MQO) (Malate dehydrogenase [quinone]) [Durusdinium trenchii]|uniref:Probable malate:quinone oxidoreductase (MQO) (Malate dehydrogenase [quinone]) n=1 Tax=Durusdinium trenchii TaxID=1381693 RepID=A0ABP0JB60_9DINO